MSCLGQCGCICSICPCSSSCSAVFFGEKYNFPAFLKRKAKSLVIPYFVLGGVIFGFFCVVYAVQNQPGTAYLEMLKNFFVQEHFWTVWFLPCLVLVEVLYYGIHRFFGKKPVVFTAVSALVCGFGLLRYRLGWGSLPWNLDIALVAQFFFHAGFLFRKAQPMLERFNQWKLPVKLLAVGGLFGLNLATGLVCIRLSGQSLDMSIGMYGNEIFTLVSAFLGILGAVALSQMVSFRWLTWLGQNTMVIFGWHSRIIIVGCQLAYEAMGIFQGGLTTVQQLIYAVVTGAVIVAVLVPLTVLIKRSKFHSIFGL